MTIRIQGRGSSCSMNYQHCLSGAIGLAMGFSMGSECLEGKDHALSSVGAPAPSPPGKTCWCSVAWHGERHHGAVIRISGQWSWNLYFPFQSDPDQGLWGTCRQCNSWGKEMVHAQSPALSLPLCFTLGRLCYYLEPQLLYLRSLQSQGSLFTGRLWEWNARRCGQYTVQSW